MMTDRQILIFPLQKYMKPRGHADLVVLPELHLGPYFCQNEDYNNFNLAQAIPGPTTEILSAVARKLKSLSSQPFLKKERRGSITIPPWF